MTAVPMRDDISPKESKTETLALSQCAAIIITWQPHLPTLKRLMQRLLGQGVNVVAVDNGSDNQSDIGSLIDNLNHTVAKSHSENEHQHSVDWLPWPENKGLAAGMNHGLGWAEKHNYRFAWLFDQDSDIGDDFCVSMLLAWQAGSQATDRLAAVGPRLVDPDSGRKTPFRRFRFRDRSDSKLADGPGLFTTDFLISSGTLLSISALQQIGLMKTSYFIDNIDLEWCFRARSQGWMLLGCGHAQLFHRIGEVSDNPLVKQGIMVSHGPLRYYYSTRNRIHLRQQSYAPADWVWRDHVRFLVKTVFLLISSKRRAEYWRALWQARRDSKELS